MFATEAVAGGLPIHIAAKVLGHKNINTTQSYTAVFDDGLVRTYRTFLDTRRTARPEAEYREPTQSEWDEFQQHFELRKLELGTCGRPYGSPCKHEHDCIRCPSLRVDPRTRPRLVEIIANLRDRIDEARANGWTGEVEGLQISLNAAGAKLAGLDRMSTRSRHAANHVAALGIPEIKPRERKLPERSSNSDPVQYLLSERCTHLLTAPSRTRRVAVFGNDDLRPKRDVAVS